MLKHRTLLLLSLIFLLSFTLAKDWKQQLGKIENSAKKVANQVGKEVSKDTQKAIKETIKAENKVENEVAKIEDKIKDAMSNSIFEDFVKAIEKIEKKLEAALSEIEDDLSPEELAEKTKKIFKNISSETKATLSGGVHKVMQNAIFEAIFGNKQKLQENYNYHNDTNVPYVIRHNPNENQRIGEGDHDWSWKKESKNQITKLLDEFPELRDEYNEGLEEIIKMIQDKKPREEILARAKQLVENIKNKLPQNEKVKELIKEIEESAEANEELSRFNLDEFTSEIRDTLETMQSQYQEASTEEKDALMSYILATNKKADELFNEIPKDEIAERLVKRIKNEINKKMESPETNYETMMQEVDLRVQEIRESQLVHVNDTSIVLRSPYAVKPREQFTFSVEDIMVSDRADIDFFEFKSMEADFPDKYKNSETEDYVVVTADTVTGIAPNKEGKYNYKTQLVYTSFRFAGESKIIDTNFTLLVGEKYNKPVGGPISFLLLSVIIGLGTITLTVVAYQIYIRF